MTPQGSNRGIQDRSPHQKTKEGRDIQGAIHRNWSGS